MVVVTKLPGSKESEPEPEVEQDNTIDVEERERKEELHLEGKELKKSTVGKFYKCEEILPGLLLSSFQLDHVPRELRDKFLVHGVSYFGHERAWLRLHSTCV